QQGAPRATGGFGSVTRSAQGDGEPCPACQVVLPSFAGTGLPPWCRSGSQSRSLQRRGRSVKIFLGDGRIDDVCRQWCSTDVFREILSKLGLAIRCGGNQCFARCREILGTKWVHGVPTNAGGRSGLQIATRLSTHEHDSSSVRRRRTNRL